MKQKDYILIIVVVFVSAVVSYFVSKAIFTTPKNRQTKVEVVQKIDPDFPEPDKKFFNSAAIDPTQQITIGDNSNPDPFTNKSQ